MFAGLEKGKRPQLQPEPRPSDPARDMADAAIIEASIKTWKKDAPRLRKEIAELEQVSMPNLPLISKKRHDLAYIERNLQVYNLEEDQIEEQKPYLQLVKDGDEPTSEGNDASEKFNARAKAYREASEKQKEQWQRLGSKEKIPDKVDEVEQTQSRDEEKGPEAIKSPEEVLRLSALMEEWKVKELSGGDMEEALNHVREIMRLEKERAILEKQLGEDKE